MEFNTEFLQFSSLGTSIYRLQVQMSIWLEIPRCRPDGRQKGSERTTMRLAFQISQKFFPELSRVRTVLPCRSRLGTSGPWRLSSGRWICCMQFPYMKLPCPDHEDRRSDVWILNARLTLWMISSGRESTSSGQLQLSSHISVLERNPIADRTLREVRTCCWNVRTDASWNS